MLSPENRQLAETVDVIEGALGPLVDRHLRWGLLEESPTSSLSLKEYGRLPTKFSVGDSDTRRLDRPMIEPVNFGEIASNILGIEPDNPMFEERIRQIDGHYDFVEAVDKNSSQVTGLPDKMTGDGWFKYLIRNGIDEAVALDMKRVGEDSYQLNTLTEDNLPAYVMETLTHVKKIVDKLGIKVPALDEWFRGIWPAEEYGHSVEMNHYGQIRRLTTTDAHIAGRTAQLRTGTRVSTGGIIEVFCYTPRQEFDTKIAHKNDSLVTGPVGEGLMNRVAKDENRHEDLYTSVLKALLHDQRTASITMKALAKSFSREEYRMPGSDGIPNFKMHSLDFERARIFGLKEDFEAARHILRKVGLLDKNEDNSYTDIKHLDEEAEEALQQLRETFDREFETPVRKRTPPFVLGETITLNELRELKRKYKREKGLVSSKAA